MQNTENKKIETVRVEDPLFVAEYLAGKQEGDAVEVLVQWYSYDAPRVRDARVHIINRGGAPDLGVECGNEWFSLASVKGVFVPVDEYDLPTVLCYNCSRRSEYKPQPDRDGGFYSLCLNCSRRIDVAAPAAAPANNAGAAFDPMKEPVGKLIDELDAAVAELAGRTIFDSFSKTRYTSDDFHKDVRRLTADILAKWNCELGSWSVSVKSGAATRFQEQILRYDRPFKPDTKTAQKLGVIDSVFFDLAVDGAKFEMTIPEVLRINAINNRRDALANFRSSIAKKAAEIAELTQLSAQYDEDLTALMSEFKRGDVIEFTDGGYVRNWHIRDFCGGGVECVDFPDKDANYCEKVFTVARLRELKAKVVRNEPFEN